MKKINWKLMNISAWTAIILAYVLPFKVVSESQNRVGFPIFFISVYDAPMNVNPLMSMHLNPVAFIANVVIFYVIMVAGIKVYHSILKKRK